MDWARFESLLSWMSFRSIVVIMKDIFTQALPGTGRPVQEIQQPRSQSSQLGAAATKLARFHILGGLENVSGGEPEKLI